MNYLILPFCTYEGENIFIFSFVISARKGEIAAYKNLTNVLQFIISNLPILIEYTWLSFKTISFTVLACNDPMPLFPMSITNM